MRAASYPDYLGALFAGADTKSVIICALDVQSRMTMVDCFKQ